MKNTLLMLGLIAGAVACDPATPNMAESAPREVPSLVQSVPDPGDYWRGRMKLFAEEAPTAPHGAVLFLGDSLTERFPLAERFPGLVTVNRGIGGERIDQMVARLDETVHALEPSTIVLLIGINDILWPAITPEQQMANYTHLVAALRGGSPEARLVLQTILPVGGKFGESMPAVLAFNDFLRGFAAAEGIELVDHHARFTDATGQLAAGYTNDGVHLSPEGYAVLAAALAPVVEKQAD